MSEPGMPHDKVTTSQVNDWSNSEDWKMLYKATAEQLIFAKSELEKCRKEIARLKEALEPFAEEANCYDPYERDDHLVAWESAFMIGDLRRARAELNRKDGDDNALGP